MSPKSNHFWGTITNVCTRNNLPNRHIGPVITLFLAPSQGLSFAAILSRHHCDTRVDRAIALSI